MFPALEKPPLPPGSLCSLPRALQCDELIALLTAPSGHGEDAAGRGEGQGGLQLGTVPLAGVQAAAAEEPGADGAGEGEGDPGGPAVGSAQGLCAGAVGSWGKSGSPWALS